MPRSEPWGDVSRHARLGLKGCDAVGDALIVDFGYRGLLGCEPSAVSASRKEEA
jgi:hypothetical protein